MTTVADVLVEEVTAAIGKGLHADRPTLIHVPIAASSPAPTLTP